MMSKKVFFRRPIYLKHIAALVMIFAALAGKSFAASGLSAVSFRNFDSFDGLSNTAVRDIVRDSSGFVWLATQSGLIRFDGYEFHSYLHDDADVSSIGNSSTSAFTAVPLTFIAVRSDWRSVIRLLQDRPSTAPLDHVFQKD